MTLVDVKEQMRAKAIEYVEDVSNNTLTAKQIALKVKDEFSKKFAGCALFFSLYRP